MTDELASKLGVLRDINNNELELMLSWRNSPGIRANMYTRHEIGLAEHLAWWAGVQQRRDQRYFMYEFNGVPRGIVAFNGIDHVNRNSLWAFYAAPDAPKGTGSSMEYLALEHAFRILQLNKLCCEVLAFNTSVIRLHEKFGFIVEGILRMQHRMEASFVDIYRLGILAAEWEAKRAEILTKLLHLKKA